MELFFVLGRNPALSTAEIACVFHAPHVVLDSGVVVVSVDDMDEQGAITRFRRLGGSLKVGAAISRFSYKDFERMFVESVAAFATSTLGEKIHIGVSVYGPPSFVGQFAKVAQKILLKQKNECRQHGQSVRVVTGKERALSSVIVAKNHLLDRGREFLVAIDGKTILLAHTLAVQDFEGQSSRDYGRPRRDPRRGILPVQLARIMVNLVTSKLSFEAKLRRTVLDPFCGIGTVLQEALLLGHTVIGSDIDPRAVEDTRVNLAWLGQSSLRGAERRSNPPENVIPSLSRDLANSPTLIQSDVRDLPSKLRGQTVDAIVTELDLGPPIRGSLILARVEEMRRQLLPLFRDAFSGFAKILKPGGRAVVALPAWRVGGSTHFVADRIVDIMSKDYTLAPSPYTLSQRGTYLYGRPDQHVWREIVVCERN